MSLRSQTLLLAVVLAVGASCQPQGLQSPVAETRLSQTVPGSANVAVRIGPPGMTTKTVAKTFDDVASVVVTLKDSGGAAVSSPGLTNPITITLPAVTGTFTGVPPGTGYYIEADARSASNASITSGTRNGNTVDVAAGVATYSSGSALVQTLDLTAASASTDASESTITPAVGTTLTFDVFKWMLINNRSNYTETSTMRGTPGPITISNVQPGATSGATHEMWLFSGVDASKKALPIQGHVGQPDGNGTIQNPFNLSMSPVTLTTPTTTAVAAVASLPMATDTAANVYYVNAAAQVIKLDSTNSFAASTLFTATAPPTGFATDGSGNVYYSTGNDIKMRQAPLYATETTVVTTTGVTQIALDEFKNLYWINGASELSYAQRLGTTYFPVTPQLGAALSAPGATMLAADAFGNVYYSTGTDIKRRARSTYGFWDGSGSGGGPLYPSETPVVSASNISGFTVDRVGDIYFTQTGSNELKLVPRGGGISDHYTVAGIGTVATPGTTALAGDPLTAANFRVPLRPTVSRYGVLYCTSTGNDDTTHYLRKIVP